MTCAHVLRTFRKAGFPLSFNHHSLRGCYASSVVSVTYLVECDTINVSTHGRLMRTEFTSHTKAIRYIQGRLSMEVVGGNDWALRTDPRGELRLVGGAA